MAHSYAIFSCRYRPLVGGVESFTYNLARSLVRAGDRVSIVTSRVGDTPPREVDDSGAEIWRLPSIPLMGARLPVPKHTDAYRYEMRALAHQGFDRILVNTRFYPHSLTGLGLAKRLDVPAVVLDHGSAYIVLGNPVADAALRAHEHAMSAACKRFRPTFAGISAASAAWLSTFGIDCHRIIPNAIDARAFRATASTRDFRSELKVAADQTLVAFVGRLEREKGADLLAQAAALTGEGFTFAFAGTGSLGHEIAACAPANTHLLGSLDHPDLSALLREADVFCLPTRSEGFCTALLEAGAWGTYPMMPRVGGTDEVMGAEPRFGSRLRSCEPAAIAEALARLKGAGALVRSQALAAHVEHDCSWEATVAALEACYD